MDEDWITSSELATLLQVKLKTLKNWRSPEYANSPLRLVGMTYRHNRYIYPMSAVREFLSRNPQYADRVISVFAPDDVRNAITQPAQPYGLLAGLTT